MPVRLVHGDYDLLIFRVIFVPGELFGKGVFALYLKEGSAFVPAYNQLLRSCGTAPVAEVAASVGIDVRSRDFWRASLEVIKDEIDRFCALCER